MIDGDNNTRIGKDIPVGKGPEAIDVSPKYNMYVANSGDNTVFVIDGDTNTRIGKDIPVGSNPVDIGIDKSTNTIYVANNNDGCN